VKEDSTLIAHIGDDFFMALRDKMQRLSGSGGPALTDIPTAVILLVLQRQQRQLHTTQPTISGSIYESCEGNDADDAKTHGVTAPVLSPMGHGSSCTNMLSWDSSLQFAPDIDFAMGIP
jgi:hypothetical protein